MAGAPIPFFQHQDGVRSVPIKVLDVAGLVPGASEVGSHCPRCHTTMHHLFATTPLHVTMHATHHTTPHYTE
jgi:hypothetical protein